MASNTKKKSVGIVILCVCMPDINISRQLSIGLPEFDFDDSDRSSIYSTPSPQSRHFQTLAPSSMMSRAAPTSLSSYHPSLRKKKWFGRQSTGGASFLGGLTSMEERIATDKATWALQVCLSYALTDVFLLPFYVTFSSLSTV